MKQKAPSPYFTGSCADNAEINISFPSGDINAPEFKFRGLAIHGDGSSYGLYLAAIWALKNLIDTEMQKEIARVEGLRTSEPHYPLVEGSSMPPHQVASKIVEPTKEVVPDGCNAEQMTLDEAIVHASEKSLGNSQCAAQHAQLAKWLTDYRAMLASAPKLERTK